METERCQLHALAILPRAVRRIYIQQHKFIMFFHQLHGPFKAVYTHIKIFRFKCIVGYGNGLYAVYSRLHGRAYGAGIQRIRAKVTAVVYAGHYKIRPFTHKLHAKLCAVRRRAAYCIRRNILKPFKRYALRTQPKFAACE